MCCCIISYECVAAGHCVILQNKFEEGQVAWDIIRKGPERLQSQFAAGYGMVLNLLYSRTLEEAKAFIDRSFNTYLSAYCVKSSCARLHLSPCALRLHILPVHADNIQCTPRLIGVLKLFNCVSNAERLCKLKPVLSRCAV